MSAEPAKGFGEGPMFGVGYVLGVLTPVGIVLFLRYRKKQANAPPKATGTPASWRCCQMSASLT